MMGIPAVEDRYVKLGQSATHGRKQIAELAIPPWVKIRVERSATFRVVLAINDYVNCI